MNEKTYTWPSGKPTLQAGVAAIESTSGKILAIGSARNRKGERVLSYATDINKQIGSTAKPLFDYGPGMEYNNWSTYTILGMKNILIQVAELCKTMTLDILAI